VEDSYDDHPVLLHQVEQRVREAAEQSPPKVVYDELVVEWPIGDAGEGSSQLVKEVVTKSFDLLVVPAAASL